MKYKVQYQVKISLAVIMCFLSICPAQGKESFTIYWENDGTFVKPNDRTDRHYTEGLKMVYTNQPACNWLREFAKWNNFSDDKTDVSTALGYFLCQNIFTPDNVGDPKVRNYKDRVFAGWLFAGLFAQRATTEQMEHFELKLGMIGPSTQAEYTQEMVHEIVGADAPKGWGKQLDDEFTIDVTWFKRQRADAITFSHTSNFDSHLEYGFTVGSVHRNAVLSVLFRAGFNLPNDFGPGRLEAPACAIYPANDEPMHFYVFSRFGGKLVEHDRFLTGLREKPVVGVIQVGGCLRHKSFELTYSQTFLTREYDEQPDEDSFASLTLNFRF